MSRRAYGLATRARRPRPSEKTAPGVIPGFPRKAIPARMTNPAEGRAPHARKEGMTPTPTLPPLGHWLILNACGGNGMPRRTYGLATRTRRAHPSEKTAFRIIPGFSPQGRPSSDGPPPGRTGSAPILPPRLDTRSPSVIIATAVHSYSSARPRGLCLDGGTKKIFPSPCKASLHLLCSLFAFLVACCRFFPACVYLLASPLRGS